MTISWTTPAALWLLAVIPFVWFALRYARTNFNPRQRRIQTVVRSLLLAMIVLALARPVVSAGSERLSIVYLVDVSQSVAPAEIVAAANKIDELTASVRPAYSRVMVFGAAGGGATSGAGSATVETTAALRHLAVADTDPVFDTLRPGKAARVNVNRAGTDIEAALMSARASLTPGALPRIVLFSDGRPTAGDTAAAIARLHADGVPVSVIPLTPPDLGDAWVDAISVPDRISSGATFAATVHVISQKASSATVELRALGKVLGTKTAALAIGDNPVTFDVALDAVGAQAIEASVTIAGDPVIANNRLDLAVTVAPRPRVLYVEGTPASAKYLTGALTAAGVDVALGAPSAFTSPEFTKDNPWDVVILSDVARSAVPEAGMKALGDWVENKGGGLLITGGEAVFGEGPQGYRKTELERIAPVTFERRDEPEIALVIVLDRSWSMNGQVMELCKNAALAAIDALADKQSVGVITFNDGFNWDVPLQNVGQHRPEIRKAVSAIEAAGQTMIYPAVEQAFKALRSVKARAKHVVLLSDGRSYPDDYEGLVKKMVDAKITVSSIAMGLGADNELLKNIATWGHGRSYLVEDAKEVPQIFVKEAKELPNLSFDEKALAPVVKHLGFLGDINFATAPALRGRTATVIKDGALEMLSTKDGDPLLAFWPIGLGRAAVFTSDVKDRWASDWITWRGYGPFFSSVVRALERQRPAAIALSVAPGVVHGTSRSIALTIEAHDADGKPRDFLTPRVRVQSGTKATVEIPARQTAPGHYEARAIVDAAEPFAAAVVGNDTGITSGLVVPDTNEEYRFRAPDEMRLHTIADATAGHWKPTAEQLSNTAGELRATRKPLWPTLLWTALALWLVDLVMRRVRVLERA